MMSLEAAIADYMENETKINPELKKKYDPGLNAECRWHLMKMAEEYLSHNSGAVEDVVVHFWIREFFLNELWDKGEKLQLNYVPVAQEKKQQKKKKVQTEINPDQMSLF